jgi:chromatin remodeling complex protein RSC6
MARKANPTFNKKWKVSEELQPVVGGKKELSRPEATKLIWKYIKAHKGIQDGRNITPDATMSVPFGKKTFTMFELAKKLGKHLS